MKSLKFLLFGLMALMLWLSPAQASNDVYKQSHEFVVQLPDISTGISYEFTLVAIDAPPLVTFTITEIGKYFDVHPDAMLVVNLYDGNLIEPPLLISNDVRLSKYLNKSTNQRINLFSHRLQYPLKTPLRYLSGTFVRQSIYRAIG